MSNASRIAVILILNVTVFSGSIALCKANDLASTRQGIQATQSLLADYCLDCHNSSDVAGELNLNDFDLAKINWDDKDEIITWEKVVKRLRARQMPPPSADRPKESDYRKALAALESALDSREKDAPFVGRTDALRRLTRTEYRNAIRDLLAVSVDVKDLLPPDQLSHGFDNITVTGLSPALLKRYVHAAEKISRLAVGGAKPGSFGMTVRVPADRDQEKHVAGLPLGTRGGTVFEYQFPTDGEYELQIRLARDRDENIEGLRDQHDIDILVDRELSYRFSVSPPKKKGGGWSKDDTMVDANLKKRIKISAGPHQIGVTFPQKFGSLSENRRQPFDTNHNRHRHPRKTPAIFEVSLVGPFDPAGPGDTPSRRKIFGSDWMQSNEEIDPLDRAEPIISRLLRLAYRRPVDESDLAIPLQFFQQRFAADGFERGIESAIAAILVNPHFLFRVESEQDTSAEQTYEISNVELASRLSFLIWSSIPDGELLELAESETLREPQVLIQQVERMLRDPRSDSLVTNFATQWLYLNNLDSFQPDARRYADFDDNLRQAMKRETQWLVRRIIRDDRSVLDLIDSDHAFLNERLARHYGIPGVLGSHFRAVDSIKAKQRGGLLRNASILAVTSYATRTSPTIRGNWILENLLGTPPPPPPPNVPSLREKSESGEVLSVRDRLAKHREDPTCASCHDLMDPVGFALENFDSVGRWRLFEDGIAIDSQGSLPDGQEIDGVDALEAGIMKRPKIFVGTLTEKLLTFALGRGVQWQDGPTIRAIVRQASQDNYKFSSIIRGIVQSTAFRRRSSDRMPANPNHASHSVAD